MKITIGEKILGIILFIFICWFMHIVLSGLLFCNFGS